jgi:hypothetical protein
MLELPRATDDRIALSGQVWNRAASELERLANVQVSPPLELTDGPAGRRLSVRIRPDRLYWGVIQCTGPAGTESDYSDNRYWVALAFVSNDQTDAATAPVTVTPYASGDPRRKVVTATNFFESNDLTHSVRPQTIVRLWAEFDRGSPAQLRWTMIVADEGTEKSAPCTAGSGSSSSSSSSNSASSASGSSLSSGSASICPPGFNGTLYMGGAISRAGDDIIQLVVGLQFCNGAQVQVEAPGYVSASLCPPPNCDVSSGSGALSAGSSGSSESSSGSGSSTGSSNSSGSGSGDSDDGSGGSTGSSSSSASCLDADSTLCRGTCDDADLPLCVTVMTGLLVACQSSCAPIPPTMSLSVVGRCEDGGAPLFYGEDTTTSLAALIVWDPDNGCYVLSIGGSAGAEAPCQIVTWKGYCSTVTGTYTRLCGADGGCDANAGVPYLSVNVCGTSGSSSSSTSNSSGSSSSGSSSSPCDCGVGDCPATITVHTSGIKDCTGVFTMTDYTLTLSGTCDDGTALYLGGDSNFSVGLSFEGAGPTCWLLTISGAEGSSAAMTLDASLECGNGPAGTYNVYEAECSGLPSTILVTVP